MYTYTQCAEEWTWVVLLYVNLATIGALALASVYFAATARKGGARAHAVGTARTDDATDTEEERD